MSFVEYLPWALPVLGLILALKYFGSSRGSKGKKSFGEEVPEEKLAPTSRRDRSVSEEDERQVEQRPTKHKSKAAKKKGVTRSQINVHSGRREPSDQSPESNVKAASQTSVVSPLISATPESPTKVPLPASIHLPPANEDLDPGNHATKKVEETLSYAGVAESDIPTANSKHIHSLVECKLESTTSLGLSSASPVEPFPETWQANAEPSKPQTATTGTTQSATQPPPATTDTTGRQIANQSSTKRQKKSRQLASSLPMGVSGGDKTTSSRPKKTGLQNAAEERCASQMLPNSLGSADGSSMEQRCQVRVLSLNHDQRLNSTLFRLKKGYTLQFRPGPTLFGRKVNVFTNYPKNLSEKFSRSHYRRLDWKSDSKSIADDTALYAEIVIDLAGSFHFYFTYDNSEGLENAQGSGYILVDPTITYGDGETLPLDCIQCQTVMSKLLGPMNEWVPRLRVAKESGYNMIHFTPVQKLGVSRSGYSLADQRVLNPEFSTPDRQYSLKDLQEIVHKLNSEWKIVSITDIVLNHTANESPWLKDHPECTYNLVNSPHLRPPYLIDRALYHFSSEISEGKWEDRGIPKALNSEKHVEVLGKILLPEVLAKIHVEEFFQVNLEKFVREFEAKIKGCSPAPRIEGWEAAKENLRIQQDPKYGRLTSTLDLEACVSLFNIQWPGMKDEENRRKRSVMEFQRHLQHLNHCKREEIEKHLQKAVSCTLGTLRYDRIQNDGPKIKEVTKRHPIVRPYFTHYGKSTNLKEEEKLSFSEKSCFLMAHNGWVMGDDPLKNFAEKDSNVYLRRELVAWGDSIKLRYGRSPEDCQFLWNLMRKYVEETATIFSGIRLDNCHSTPIHVAEYLMDCARRIRPDLYVIAELFTNSDLTDNIFVNRLGINSLIREAMSASNSHEEGRLVYRYGGEPVGAFILPPVRPLVPSVAHAIFLDMTHDNRSPCQVRTAWDMLPSTSLVNMACCASGSNRGYDEIVPHHIHVVNEERRYNSWSEDRNDKATPGFVTKDSGIISAKRLLNQLHFELGHNGYSQVFVDQVTEHIVTVTRHNPITHQSVVLVAYTCFREPSSIHHENIRPLKVQGQFEEIIFELSLKVKAISEERKRFPGKHVQDKVFINGVNEFILDTRERLQPSQSTLVRQISPPGAHTTELEYTSAFRPGSVIAIRLSLLPAAREAVTRINGVLCDFGYKKRITEVATQNVELLRIVSKLTLADLNRILFRCDSEERDEGRGGGAYDIPNFGQLVYCGFQGIVSALSAIRIQNDLGHPICGNLRDGDWLMDYVSGRLKLEAPSEPLGMWLQNVFDELKKVPRYLIPAYFDSVITVLYLTLVNYAWSLMGKFTSEGSDFVKSLALCSLQFCGVVKSALLPPLTPHLEKPHPPTSTDSSGRVIQTGVSLSAGLPHFSVGYTRNWGRDTFIALPGNLLITGRYPEARWIILAFAGTLRHGLIPNLLDGGPKARFNCRDAVWFWLYSIQQYVNIAPNGRRIFKDKVSRLFPNDDSSPQPPGANDQSLEFVIQECLQRHFEGVKFRERNAGSQIDSQMTDQGFSNEIGVDLNTGFPFGGNAHNCGTWMDKMGSSEKAGNKGQPATPRDGSPVEIVGLCASTLEFLDQMHREGVFTYNEVRRRDKDGNQINWTYKFWLTMITDSFEKHFWISDSPDHDRDPNSNLINRRGLYKDVLGSSSPWTDYQLRPNFPIAIAVAPQMVAAQHAWTALSLAEESLLGPLGMKTLDPTDWKYRGDYDNANNSNDPNIAKGFNYHQGPEWVWPIGWFLKAKLAIAARLGVDELRRTICHVRSLMAPHFTHILTSPWRSLPELTNSNGSHCPDSNPAQSWSTGCLLEVLWEMRKLESQLEGGSV